jgi:UDP-N-acetylmuramoyl-L-alanyl-D-glutamate--2,6-diaminopimelate ligase
VKLEDLLRGVEVSGSTGDLGVAVGSIRDDSRSVEKGDVFVAVRGHTVDGHAFVDAAAARGAAAIIAEHDVPFSGPRVRVPSTARALGRLAANRVGNPADRLTMVGVTGTNGKTTTTHIIEAILAAAGARAGILGTIRYRFAGAERDASLTTPGAIALQSLLAEMLSAGTTHVVMEVSSIALDQARLEGVAFDAGAFTNLTQDHLDYHGTMESYLEAKALLFSRHLRADRGVGVSLVDSDAGRDLLAQTPGGQRRIACSIRPGADVSVARAELGLEGIQAQLDTPRGPLDIRSPLLAAHNLENVLVAVGVAEALELPREAIVSGVRTLAGVPGRLERVEVGGERTVLVDYAHTPDALERAIAAVRPLVRGRLIVIFGCGGDRDRTKRPRMGAIAARGADLAIVTSDNPRTEDPEAIVHAIVEGIRTVRSDGFLVEIDRRAAIRRGWQESRAGDVILIAGKGHEDYQIVGTTKRPFDDREEAREAARSGGAG